MTKETKTQYEVLTDLRKEISQQRMLANTAMGCAGVLCIFLAVMFWLKDRDLVSVGIVFLGVVLLLAVIDNYSRHQ